MVAVTATVFAMLSGTAAAAGAPDNFPVPPVANPASLVNPMIGTDMQIPPAPSGSVNVFPGPDVPFGMIQWSPDTSPNPAAGGGYTFSDSAISGFSLTHISGPGCGAFGDVPILPVVGPLPKDPSNATEPYSHVGESASAGYYAVYSGVPSVFTEMTAAAHSAISRYTFPPIAQSNLLLKLSGSQNGDAATSATVVGNNEVTGSVTSGQFCGASDMYTVHFDIVFDHPFVANGTWTGTTITPGTQQVNATATTAPRAAAKPSKTTQAPSHPVYHGAQPNGGKAAAQAAATGPDGVYLTFDTSHQHTLQAKVGISFVSSANAAANIHADQPGWDFNGVHQRAFDAWNKELSKIQVGGGSTDRQTVFYTALYHSLLHPNIFSDVNGQYMGFDNKVHTVTPGHVQVANYSSWDTYRSQAQLEAIVDPTMASDSAQSMVNDAAQNNGMLPKWALANGESYVMVGDPADGLIGGYYAFGARNFDTRTALSDMLAEATKPNNIRPGLNYLESLGYLPTDGTYGCCNFYGSVSTTLEYGAADFALSQYAAALGDKTDAQMLERRSQDWQNLFNPATGLIQPKTSSGAFVPVTMTTQNNYVEGDASQYRWIVPWNKAGLVAAMGGNTAVNSALDTFWTKLNDGSGSPFAFWDNQFAYETPWSYDFTGAPYKTQQLVDRIRTQLYLNSPAGEGDNDDLGATASMGVLTMLGFYPMYIANADVTLNSPEFPLEIIHLANGKKLTFTAPQASSGNIYVQSATLDGKTWTKPWLPGSVFTTGGRLDFTLGATPNTTWGTASADAPPSFQDGQIPAFGLVQPGGQTIVAPGASFAASIGARNVTGTSQTITWTAKPDNGITVTPASGTVTAGPTSDQTQPVTIAGGNTEGRFNVTFQLSTASGTQLPSVGLNFAVAKPGEIWPYYGDVGAIADGQSSTASFDGDGFLYSANALAAAGVTPGGTVKADGLTYTWPGTGPSGALDNIDAAGQTVPVSLPAGSTRIGLLGSATNAGSSGATGTLTVTYTDGSTQQIPVGLSDWTLGAGSFPPLAGNTIVANTPYRDTGGGGKQMINTYVFATNASLTAGKTVASVTMPTPTGGNMHVFAIGAG